jgi:hypothetical protein
VKARVICNPASSGGGYEPEELHGELLIPSQTSKPQSLLALCNRG